MADAGRDEVAGMVLGAWDAFLQQAETVDLDRPSRLDGWRAHEICVHLGCWDDHTALADLIASARNGGAGTPPDVDAVNARVTAAHRDASREEVLAALRRNRDATADYLAEGAGGARHRADGLGRRPPPAAERRPGAGVRARRPRAGPGVLRRRSPAAATCCSPVSPRSPT